MPLSLSLLSLEEVEKINNWNVGFEDNENEVLINYFIKNLIFL